MKSPEAGGALPFVVLAGVSAALVVCGLTNGHEWGGDFAAYVMQGLSLVEGNVSGFVEANRFTILESSAPLGPVTYPWGFPLALAPVIAVFGTNLLALKAVGSMAFLGFLVLLWVGFRRDHTRVGTLSLVALFALNPTMLEFTNRILSDLPFLFLSTLCLIMIRSTVIDGAAPRRRRDLAAIGFVAALAWFVRPNGLLLLGGLGAAHFVHGANGARPGRPSARTLLPYGVFAVMMIVATLVSPSGGGQGSAILDVSLPRIVTHFRYYLELPSRFLTDVPHGLLLYGASLPLAIVGLLRRAKSDVHVVVYGVLTLLLYIAWPSRQGLRFLLPVLPFYISFVLTGIEAFIESAPERMRAVHRACCAVPIGAVLVAMTIASTSAAAGNLERGRATTAGPYSPDAAAMFEFVERSTAPDDVVLFYRPRIMRMLTDRPSITAHTPTSLGSGDVLVLYLHPSANEQVEPGAVRPFEVSGDAVLEYENPSFRVFRLTR